MELQRCINIANFDTIDLESMAEDDDFQEVLKCFEEKDNLPSEFKKITDINHIVFGHFIILEKIITSGLPESSLLKKILPYIIRPSEETTLDNEDVEREKKHIERVLKLPIGVGIKIFKGYIELRNKYIYKDYNGVIYEAISDEEEKKDEDEGETNIDSSMSAREDYNTKFFWFNLIGIVAGDDIFKRDKAIELYMYQVMPFLAEKRYRQIIERMER